MSQLGAADFALRIARQFGRKCVEPRPALVPLVFEAEAWQPFAQLAGVALEARISTATAARTPRRARPAEFLEDVLFTHRGLSGPGILQISSYWQSGTPIRLDLSPGRPMESFLLQGKSGNRQQLDSVLSQAWPRTEERSVGKECVRTCRSRGSPD